MEKNLGVEVRRDSGNWQFVFLFDLLYVQLHPRLQGDFSLHRRARYMGLNVNLGSNSDVKGSDDPKSEGEKHYFRVRSSYFQKARNLIELCVKTWFYIFTWSKYLPNNFIPKKRDVRKIKDNIEKLLVPQKNRRSGSKNLFEKKTTIENNILLSLLNPTVRLFQT